VSAHLRGAGGVTVGYIECQDGGRVYQCDECGDEARTEGPLPDDWREHWPRMMDMDGEAYSCVCPHCDLVVYDE